jgi:hypothetical protein
MAASKKAIDNANRLRYIRALERFSKSIVSYLSNNADVTKERFDKKIANAKKLYDRVEEVALYKGELQDLQKFVKKMIAYQQSKEDIQKIQEDILYTANQLDKSKNARRYKKEKHSKSKFEEWE